MKLRTSLLLSLFCTSFLLTPAIAADPQAAANSDASKNGTTEMTGKAKPKHFNTARSAGKTHRAECVKQAHGKTGSERKKFIHDCMSGTLPATAAKEEKKPADTTKASKSEEQKKPAQAKVDNTTPKEPPKPAHKDAFPAERVNQNPRLLERSCMMDANEQGLTGQARTDYLKNCVSSGVPQTNFKGK